MVHMQDDRHSMTNMMEFAVLASWNCLAFPTLVDLLLTMLQ